MNEDAAVQAVRTFLDANKATLVTALSGQGKSRGIKRVWSNLFVPPSKGYFHIAVHCIHTEDVRPPIPSSNVDREIITAYYDMAIEVSDLAMPQRVTDGDESYSTYVANFRKLGDRIVKLLWDNRWYPTAGSSPRFTMPHQEGELRIAKANMHGAWDETGTFFPMLRSVINFRMFEHRADTSKLY